MPASTAAGEMDNFQLSISLSQKLSERQREERGQTDVCKTATATKQGRGRRPNAQDSTEARGRIDVGLAFVHTRLERRRN